MSDEVTLSAYITAAFLEMKISPNVCKTFKASSLHIMKT